jgi:hypothetical protein
VKKENRVNVNHRISRKTHVHDTRAAGNGHPGLLAAASFFARSKGLQAKRLFTNIVFPVSSLSTGSDEDFPFVLAESISPLHTGGDPRERLLVLGKIHNLRLACRQIHHRQLVPGQTFSFWREVGPPWRRRGFAVGREVREGCIIPTPGGGLCQLSGSLLEVALALDFELVERHRHTALPADVSYNECRDATLFWNYADLRFRTPRPVLLEAYLTRDALVVRFKGKTPSMSDAQSLNQTLHRYSLPKRTVAESCYTCDHTLCARHHESAAGTGPRKTAYLVDDYQPEFDTYIGEHMGTADQLFMPFAARDGRPDWRRQGFEKVRSFSLFRLERAARLRWAALRGMTVAKAHFGIAETLAKIYQKHIGCDVEHLCIAQTLLPHLWRAGVLGGRTFDVLMQRVPIQMLQQRLDDAVRRYPQSATLAEFRAPRWFAAAEEEALGAARTLITPHPQIAALFHNATRLPWQMPAATAAGGNQERDLIVFLGPTLARKGAYAVRDAVRKMGFPLTIVGSELEEKDFWKGLPVTRRSLQHLAWERVHTVVQPALFEYWPRQLLRAHAAGSRLVISPFCGIDEDHDQGVYHVPFGDSDALIKIMETLLTIPGGVLCA